MKKAVKALFVLLFIILTVSGALAAEKKNKPEIKTVDNYVAVFDFEVRDKDKDISRPLVDSVIHEFSQSDKYEVIDRGNMNKILGEQKFQMSGCVAQECKVEAGRILGVGKIVNGSVGLVGKTYYLTLQLIDVKTGKVELSAEDECRCEREELFGSTRMLVKKLLGEKVEQSVAIAPKPAVAAKPAGPEPKINNSIGMTFVYIKPGTFMMGSPSDEPGRDSDETQHQATLTRGYYMQTTEVTQGQWQAVMGNNPSYFNNCGEDCPVEQVSWNDAQEFIRRLNQKESISGYRLPTEAEWEYAERAGTNTVYSFGDSDSQLSNYAWYAGNSGGKTHPVAQKNSNSWGLYDMHGNAWEWYQDWYGSYPTGSVTDPKGPSSGSYRVHRGGSWRSRARGCRSANRYFSTPDFRDDNLGFRLSRDVTKPSEPKPVPTSIAIIPPVAPAKETARDGRFIAYDNGTVSDTRSNLMWAAKDNGSNINWVNAKSYCENYRGGGYTDWRMPTQDELAGLYDKAKTYQSECRGLFSTIDIHLTELIRLTCYAPWASETRGSDAAFFNFTNGARHWLRLSFASFGRALPVRSGK